MDRVDNLVIPDVTKQHYILNIDVYPKFSIKLADYNYLIPLL
jgi:hypothetical protein